MLKEFIFEVEGKRLSIRAESLEEAVKELKGKRYYLLTTCPVSTSEERSVKMFEVYLKSGDSEKVLATFEGEDLAEDFCRAMGWEWEDENGFIWNIDYREFLL